MVDESIERSFCCLVVWILRRYSHGESTGLDCHTVGFDYGQKHRSELKAAQRIADALGDHPHKVIRLDLGSIGGLR